jgi:hypothetical protein
MAAVRPHCSSPPGCPRVRSGAMNLSSMAIVPSLSRRAERPIYVPAMTRTLRRTIPALHRRCPHYRTIPSSNARSSRSTRTGKPSFNLLQNFGPRELTPKASLFYYVFDVLILRHWPGAPDSGTSRRILISDRLYCRLASVAGNMTEAALHWRRISAPRTAIVPGSPMQ